MREIIFDTETTGVDPESGDRVVEIGAIELLNGAVTGRNYHAYINPERDMPEGAYRVHGLSAEFLADKPVFADPSVCDAFMEFIADATLVAHNANFDVRFINSELKRLGRDILENEGVDTLVIARRKYPGSPASLDALCSRFNIDTSIRERDGHGALLDSELLASVYVELTGGAQAGLGFDAEEKATRGSTVRKAAPKRDAPAPILITDDERGAHADFIAGMGGGSVWARIEGQA